MSLGTIANRLEEASELEKSVRAFGKQIEDGVDERRKTWRGLAPAEP